MLYDDRKHRRHRRRQAQYEARQRAGIAVYPVPLSAAEIDILVALRCLPEGGERDREQVSQAIVAMIRGVIQK
jgi:hypothetical protein